MAKVLAVALTEIVEAGLAVGRADETVARTFAVAGVEPLTFAALCGQTVRSEERRVGKECRL